MSTEVAIIVPTVLGLGLVVSMMTLARDALHRLRGPGWMSRRCGIEGRGTALVALGSPEAARRDDVGTRSRRTYAVVAVACLPFGLYLFVGSWGNYIGWTGWVESIGWIFVAYLAVLAAFTTVGVVAAALWLRVDDPPTWIRRPLARTALGRVPDRASVETTVIAHPAHVRRVHRPAPVRPLGPHHVTDAVAAAARTVAGVWTLLAVAGLGWATLRGAVPTTPEELDAAVAGPVWVALYVVLVVSSVAVYRWELAGAVGIAVAATGLALVSSVQFPPWVALAVAAVFAVPAFLHWLAWQRDHHVHHLVRVGALTSLLLVGVWSGAEAVYSHYFGATHPSSSVVAAPRSPVVWAWTGGTSSTGTTVVAEVRAEGDDPVPVRLLVEPAGDGATATGRSGPGGIRYSPEALATAEGHHVVRLSVDGLAPGTTYRWWLEVDGEIDDVRDGLVRTMPVGPASFTLAASACARSGSNGAVFDAIRRRQPLAYLQLGDLHYANIGEDDPARFRAAYRQLLTAPGQAALYRSTSLAYTWDDHDYGANDADATSPSRPAAGSTYREWVPHHPLVSEGATGPIGQSFVAGRVRVVMTDTRSQRTPPGAATGDEQHVLGPEQERWFAEELAAAHDAGQVVVWASSTPWIGEADLGGDTWAGYPDARRRVADLIAGADMSRRLVAVAGDAHMVALDDGTHTDYSTSGAGGFPLLQAAALDRPGSTKGGPYSAGTFPGGGQYGEIEVVDEGGSTVTVTLRGSTWDGEVLVQQSFDLPVPPTP